MTKASIYWHFPSKEALYLDCLQQLYGIILGALQSIPNDRTPEERLRQVFHTMADLADDVRIRQGIAGYWLPPATAVLGKMRDIQEQFEKNIAGEILSLISSGVRAGRLDAAIPIRQISQAFVSLMQATILPLGLQTRSQNKELVSTLAGIFFRAYGLPKA
jgi:AcrR family transcriptional regulator